MKPSAYIESDFEGELDALLHLRSEETVASCNAGSCNTRWDHEKFHELQERLEDHRAYFIERWRTCDRVV